MENIKLSLPISTNYLLTTRLTTKSICANMGFDVETIEDIVLCVSEACNNVLVHSKCKTNYEIDYKVTDDAITIEIKDFGDGFDVDGEIKNKPGDEEGSGLGLLIMKSLMDEVICDSNENCTSLQLIKYLEK